MVDWLITLRKAVTAFFAAGGAAFVTNLLLEFPQDAIVWGSITVGSIAAVWRALTDGIKHKGW